MKKSFLFISISFFLSIGPSFTYAMEKKEETKEAITNVSSKKKLQTAVFNILASGTIKPDTIFKELKILLIGLCTGKSLNKSFKDFYINILKRGVNAEALADICHKKFECDKSDIIALINILADKPFVINKIKAYFESLSSDNRDFIKYLTIGSGATTLLFLAGHGLCHSLMELVELQSGYTAGPAAVFTGLLTCAILLSDNYKNKLAILSKLDTCCNNLREYMLDCAANILASQDTFRNSIKSLFSNLGLDLLESEETSIIDTLKNKILNLFSSLRLSLAESNNSSNTKTQVNYESEEGEEPESEKSDKLSSKGLLIESLLENQNFIQAFRDANNIPKEDADKTVKYLVKCIKNNTEEILTQFEDQLENTQKILLKILIQKKKLLKNK